MAKLLSFFSSSARQLQAARNLFTHAAQALDVPISVRLWDGSMVPLGRAVHPDKFVSLSGPGVIGSLLRRPTVDNLLRQYATGQIDFHGGDLMSFFDAARVRNSRERARRLPKWDVARNLLSFLFAPAEKIDVRHEWAGNTVGAAKEQRKDRDYVQFHYDLGNDFYRMFLDGEMQYSCGYFTDPNNSLDQAQLDKLEMICRKLRLKPGESLLDIGCGWGGLVCYAARKHGVRAHGVTLSQAQFDFATEKVRRLGLEDRVKIELRDYNTVEGTYDKIASIGMYEHVGIANYPAYFGKIHSLLRERGILLNHGITRRAKHEKSFHKQRPVQRLINKYIFPGGELDHIGHTCAELETCRFEVHDVENWRTHYAQTARLWCQRLSARRDEAIAQVGPERYRLWVAYLAGVSFGFQDGTLRIYQVVASKHSSKGAAELPATRADLYRQAG